MMMFVVVVVLVLVIVIVLVVVIVGVGMGMCLCLVAVRCRLVARLPAVAGRRGVQVGGAGSATARRAHQAVAGAVLVPLAVLLSVPEAGGGGGRSKNMRREEENIEEGRGGQASERQQT